MGQTREDLRRHFREALAADPAGAYRDWFRAQEELRERREAETARALADDLWQLLPGLAFRSAEERARFLHNAGVFYGSPGPAADLGRARRLFGAALEHFSADHDGHRDWRARAHHNLATAISNLAETPEELAEAAALFERALEWRDADRGIARGVTLHNMGIALRRLADLDPPRAAERLAASAAALREAVEIRDGHGLAAGRALSREQLAITLARLDRGPGAPSPRER